MSDLFISYSRKDRAFVQQLYTALQAANRDAWVDWEDIPPSAEWRLEIQAAIEAADAFLFIISPDSLKSRVCAEELAHAVSQNKRILPLLHRDPAGEPVPEALSRLNYIYGRTQDPFDHVAQTLFRALDTDLEHVRAHTRLLVRAHEWETRQRIDSYLLRGEDLREAETWLAMDASKEPHPTALHAEYIAASRGAETRRQRRLLIAAAAALVVMTVLAALAIWQAGVATSREMARATQQSIAEANEQLANQREMARATQQAIAEANEQLANQREMARATQEALAMHRAGLNESGRLAALAQLEINDGRPETAVQLALYALENLPYTVQAEHALAQAVQSSRLLGYLPQAQAARWSPDGRSWAAVRPDNAVAVLDALTQQEAWRVPFDSQVKTLLWSPDGERLLVQEIDGDDSLLAAADGGLLLRRHGPPLEEHASIRSQWAPDGGRIATILNHKNYDTGEAVRIWDPESGETLLALRVDPAALPDDIGATYNEAVGDLAWSPDGSQIVVTHPLYGCCGMITFWDAHSGALLQALGAGSNYNVAWSPDGRWIATSGIFHGNVPYLWDAQSRTPLEEIPLGPSVRTGEIAWSPDSRYLAAVSADEDELWVWDIERSEIGLQVTGSFDQVDWAPDSQRLLAHERGPGRASLLTLRPVHYRLELEGGQTGAWSPDGSQVLHATPPQVHRVAASLENPGIQPDGADLPILGETLWFGTTARVSWLANDRLAVTDGFTSELWDLRGGAILPIDETLAGEVVTWSPSGVQYAITRREDLQVYVYSAQGELRYTLPGTTPREGLLTDLLTIQVAWDPAETRLATSDGNLVRLWDAATGGALGTLEGGPFPVSSLSWSPDGARLATTTGYVLIGATGHTASGENLVRVWDVASQQEVFRLESPQDTAINLAAWSPDGHYLLTGNPIPGEDRLVIWRAWPSLEDLVQFARDCCAVRQLSADEMERFGLGE